MPLEAPLNVKAAVGTRRENAIKTDEQPICKLRAATDFLSKSIEHLKVQSNSPDWLRFATSDLHASFDEST